MGWLWKFWRRCAHFGREMIIGVTSRSEWCVLSCGTRICVVNLTKCYADTCFRLFNNFLLPYTLGGSWDISSSFNTLFSPSFSQSLFCGVRLGPLSFINSSFTIFDFVTAIVAHRSLSSARPLYSFSRTTAVLLNSPSSLHYAY